MSFVMVAASTQARLDLIERLAIIMAEGLNGGKWDTHYTFEQQDLWCRRAEAALRIKA